MSLHIQEISRVMKKLFSIASVIIFLTTSSFTPAEELKWFDFNEGYDLAKKKNKIIQIL